ncbi:hypothetical protein JCM33374_g1722 [Metschnikowia sp. JCM 33374]|nr:hypothetical protein JCM33374_g1722 [Metschnikowia sp. JCM 33374]
MRYALSLTLLLSLALCSSIQASGRTPIKTKKYVSVLKATNIKQDTNSEACIYGYALSEHFQNLPFPKWISGWDELMPNTFCSNKYDIKVSSAASDQEVAQMLLFSLESGYAVDTWDKDKLKERFSGMDLDGIMSTLWETGDIPSEEIKVAVPVENIKSEGVKSETDSDPSGSVNIFKRIIFKTQSVRWLYDSAHSTKVWAMRALLDSLSSQGNIELILDRSAICQTTNSQVACLSWSGGDQRIKANVAAAVIRSGIGNLGDDASISCRARKALKNNQWNAACLSNRPNGCRG